MRLLLKYKVRWIKRREQISFSYNDVTATLPAAVAKLANIAGAITPSWSFWSDPDLSSSPNDRLCVNILDKTFPVKWENYMNTLLLTNESGLNKIPTKIYSIVDIKKWEKDKKI